MDGKKREWGAGRWRASGLLQEFGVWAQQLPTEEGAGEGEGPGTCLAAMDVPDSSPHAWIRPVLFPLSPTASSSSMPPLHLQGTARQLYSPVGDGSGYKKVPWAGGSLGAGRKGDLHPSCHHSWGGRAGSDLRVEGLMGVAERATGEAEEAIWAVVG